MLAFSAGAYASSTIKVVVNGKTAKADAKLINNVTYVPLRAVSEMLGATVNWDNKTNTVNITNGGMTAPAPSNLSQTYKDVNIKIDKVVQDSDSLRLYVTYTNNSGKAAMTGDSLAKVVANGKQHDYDFDFNFDRWYEQDVPHAQSFIEPTVSEPTVIFFRPVSAETINIVLNANFNEYRFNNVKISK